jgi:uridine kinase
VDVVVLGICGGSGSGKSTLATACGACCGDDDVVVLPFDAYYRDLTHLTVGERKMVNFDHPDSLDVELFASHLDALRSGQAVGIPMYDFATHTRTGSSIMVGPASVVIAEGILLLSVATIATRLDYTVFLDVPEDTRFERRLARDTVERGRDATDVQRQFEQSVAPMHNQFVQPFGPRADRVLLHPWNVVDVADEVSQQLRSVAPA